MSRIAPATRIRLVEAISGLQRLRREMARLSQVDENYDAKKHAPKLLFRNYRNRFRRVAHDGMVPRAGESDAPSLVDFSQDFMRVNPRLTPSQKAEQQGQSRSLQSKATIAAENTNRRTSECRAGSYSRCAD